ncbi:MAG TPA: hypothetical protein VHU87_11390 [Rhizomicrobium sp.]|jgi:hypothetical protein|nr:hypothetical protein [Rhizomicrobium sp.]
MIDRRDNDDELVAQVRRSIRIQGRVFGSLLVMFLSVSVIFLGILKFHLPKETASIAALIVLLIWITMVFRFLRAAPLTGGHYSEEILRRTIDDQHRRWRWLFVFIFINVVAYAIPISLWLALPAARHMPSGIDPAAAVFAMNLAGVAVFAALQVCFGPSFLTRTYRRILNDELTRAMQCSAAMFGYVLSVVAMCLALGAATIRPQWGLAAMPGAIAASVILPGLYFLILQWRAGRDG